MRRSTPALAALGAAFVLVLLYTSLRSTPTPLGGSREDRLAASAECRRSVELEVPEGRFPFDESVEELGGGRLHLSGAVDSGTGAAAVRRNYDCYLRRGPAAGDFVSDSTLVWQSH